MSTADLIHHPDTHLLGKLDPKHDPRTLRMARYFDLSVVLPTCPVHTNRAQTNGVVLQMFANNRLGDCTCAGMGNAEEFWAAQTKRTIQLGDSDIIGAYSAITGYDPATGANDGGAVELDVLNWWRQTGLAGHKITAFAAIDLGSQDLARAAIWLLDGAYLGIALPITAQSQQVWDYDPSQGTNSAPGSWGGHCVVALDYNETGPVVATWGGLKQMTWAFWQHYCDEAYGIIADDEFNDGGLTAEGFARDALAADLQAVAA